MSDESLAIAVLTLAQDGGMPSSYWATDSRIALACGVLGVDLSFAEQATEENYDLWKKALAEECAC